jgi:hypothetical protein
MRTAVTLYLLAFTIAGQGLCCCTLEQMARELVTPAAPVTTTTRPAQKPCCAHHHQQTATKSTNVPQPQTPDPCPCKQHGQLPVLAPQATTRTLLDLQPRYNLDSATLSSHCDDATRVDRPLTDKGRAGGFVTAEDLLRAFHILRC